MNKLLEELNLKKEEVLKEKKEIEIIKKEKLYSKEKEYKELQKKVNQFSKYEPISILSILSKLTTIYEGVEYNYQESPFGMDEYYIDCKENTIYKAYKVKATKEKKFINVKKWVEDEYILLLPETIYEDHPYISTFINYLFNKRVEEELYEIDNNKLEEILNEFLEKTKSEQKQRLEENKNKLVELKEKEKRIEFEDSCMIDRQSFFDTIISIINNYEDDISADIIYDTVGDIFEINAIAKLIIKDKEKERIFETIIDTDTCIDEDFYRDLSVRYDINTNINFFKFKNTFSSIFKNGKYINKFMEKVENLYTNDKRIVGYEDLNSLYQEFLNEKDLEELVDLHMHSTYSDGELTPKELIEECINKNIKHISITDHDTLEGNKEVLKIIKDYNIKYTTGIELSAKVDHGRMHILGYNIDVYNKKLNDKMATLRNNSLYSIISLLHQIKADYNIRFKTEDILDLLNANHNLGRPDLARLLIKYNYASYTQEAFDKYLIPAYEKTRKTSKGISYKECIELIKTANGIPVLAHPKTLKLKKQELCNLLEEMISYGLMGIEVYNSIHSKEEIEFYTSLANKYNLLISGGTDYHGINVKPDIELGTGINGNMKVKKLTILDKL